MATRYVYRRANVLYTFNKTTSPLYYNEDDPPGYTIYKFSSLYGTAAYSEYFNTGYTLHHAPALVNYRGSTASACTSTETLVDESYDEETGNSYYTYNYEYYIPAGYYFCFSGNVSSNTPSFGYYTSSSAHNYGTYNSANYGDSWETHTKKNCAWYALTDVYVTIQCNEGDEDYSYHLVSTTGTIQQITVSISASTYNYYSSSKLISNITFSYNNKIYNEAQYYGNYVYIPVTYDTNFSIDPSSVALSNNPVVNTSNTAVITSSVSPLSYGTLTYLYQYAINGSTSWTTISSTTAASCTFIIPSNATSIQVRVQASDGIGFTSSNYITSPIYTVSSYKAYSSISGAIKGVNPVVAVGGGYGTVLSPSARVELSKQAKARLQYISRSSRCLKKGA